MILRLSVESAFLKGLSWGSSYLSLAYFKYKKLGYLLCQDDNSLRHI